MIQLSNWPSSCKYSLHCSHNNKLQLCIYFSFHTINLSVHAFSLFFCFCQLQRFGQADAKGQNDPNFGWCHPFDLHCQQSCLGVDKTLPEVHERPLKIWKCESNFDSPCQEQGVTSRVGVACALYMRSDIHAKPCNMSLWFMVCGQILHPTLHSSSPNLPGC